MFNRILVATDGSPVSERQVLYVEHLARVESAEIVVLHAYEPPAGYTGYAGYDQLVASYRAVAQAIVDDMSNALQETRRRPDCNRHTRPEQRARVSRRCKRTSAAPRTLSGAPSALTMVARSLHQVIILSA